MSLEQLFQDWWSASYPNVKPAPHTVSTHCAFAEYVDKMRTEEVLAQLREAGADDSLS